MDNIVDWAIIPFRIQNLSVIMYFLKRRVACAAVTLRKFVESDLTLHDIVVL